MLRAAASTPVTWAPSRAIGSLSRPPPQPISSRRQALQRRARQRIALPVGRGAVADEAEPHRVQPVQRRELAARVPPLLGDAREALDLGRIDGGPAWYAPNRPWLPLTHYGAPGVYTPLSSRSMARIVLKFGGTSVGDIDRIKNVARKVKAEVDARQRGRRRGLGHVGRHQPAREMGQRDRAAARCRANTTSWSRPASR